MPFCSGTCLATFSLWKLKNTNLPRKSDRPVLRLITNDGFSSALHTIKPRRCFTGLTPIRFRETMVSWRRPWKAVHLSSCGLSRLGRRLQLGVHRGAIRLLDAAVAISSA
uniref:Uncharacterized protein n=1 Tax=Opuntia streptacantha TaxID=393608 RepID=A0A7C8Z386_OPUST